MPITATIWHSDELVYNGQCHCCNFPPSGLTLPAASVSHAALHLTTFQMNIWHQYAANFNTPLNSWELIQNTLDRIIFPLQLRGLHAFFPESTENRKSICFTFKFFWPNFYTPKISERMELAPIVFILGTRWTPSWSAFIRMANWFKSPHRAEFTSERKHTLVYKK